MLTEIFRSFLNAAMLSPLSLSERMLRSFKRSLVNKQNFKLLTKKSLMVAPEPTFQSKYNESALRNEAIDFI